MYCKIIKVSNNFYSLSVWDLEDNMVFWNASKDKNYLIKFAKANKDSISLSNYYYLKANSYDVLD